MKAADTEPEKKSEIVQRVQQVLTHYGLNASSATQKLGYSTTSKLYNILKGSEPSYPTLVDFLRQWPDLSPEWLMLGQGPMLRGENGGAAAVTLQPPKARDGQPAVNSGSVLVVTVGMDGEDNVELVPVNVQAGYTVQHNEAVFVSELPKYRLPRFERGKFRAFEVAGDSMEPTLNHNDIVVCSYVDNWRLLVPDDIYVIVTTESVMLKRIRARINSRTDEVILYSDNPHRRPYPVDASDITELWRVRGYISTYLPSAPDVTVERLWEVIEALGFDRGEVRRHLEENAPDSAPRAK
ncbi:LexA family transcriptional regulator [Hymenobacter lutimineralis]|uniref:LexA family transcriptional regulator n=1 Tax=Hymenobacter lutimineralis TaxID=2606448 RepID=A0A5D6VDT8_9BACT|nr:LexA family transcriptional regulator [Hymenobacter lutimineralis]TYZ12724.1 LexA family transcriptional regulator [Hymenobacter lutimineralis]